MPDHKYKDKITCPYCDWRQVGLGDDDISWETACENEFVLIEGNPTDNNFKFCPNCGRPIRQHKTEGEK